MNEPLYVASTVGEKGGCSSDNDCQQYVPFSKCHTSASTSNHYKGLCYTTNVTTFTKSTTVTTPIPTTAMSTTVPAPKAGTTTTESTTAMTEPMTVATESSVGPITDAIRTKIVTMHNYRRSRLAQGLVPNGSSSENAPQGKNIYELTYNKDLELEAQNYADTCPSNGSSLASRNYSGENFGVVPSSSVRTYYGAVFRAVKLFWNEIKMHGINEDLLFSMHATNETTAPLRFTQVSIRFSLKAPC
ncbi:SCP-like protein, partial [Teladorsagia circumcincta]